MVSGNQLKKIFLLTTLTLCVGMMSAIPVGAQKMERRAAGKTYVYDLNNKRVYNKSFSPEKQKYSTEGFYVKNNDIVKKVFRSVLDGKRIASLRHERVIMSFVCDANGKIESVRFLFPTTAFLTIEEIAALEEGFLTESFPLTVDSGVEKVGFSQACRFWDL